MCTSLRSGLLYFEIQFKYFKKYTRMKYVSPADCVPMVQEYIRCATPFNFWSYILLLGFSIAAFFSPVVRSITKNFPMVTIICLIFNVSYSKPFFLDYYQVSSQWQKPRQIHSCRVNSVILRQTGFRILSRGSRSTNWSEIVNNVKAISINLFSDICVRYPYYHRRCEVCQTPGLPGYQ